MQIERLDELAQELAKIKEQIKPLKDTLKDLEDKEYLIEEEFRGGLIEHNKDSWEIKGYKPFRLKISTYYNVLDPEQLLKWAAETPGSCSAGYLGQAVRGFLNEQAEQGVEPPACVTKYEKVKVSGGQAV